MEYSIIEASSTRSLESMVGRAIQGGWQPQGGVNGFYTAAGYHYQQAMVRISKQDRARSGEPT